jgi:hypothetical protein
VVLLGTISTLNDPSGEFQVEESTRAGRSSSVDACDLTVLARSTNPQSASPETICSIIAVSCDGTARN